MSRKRVSQRVPAPVRVASPSFASVSDRLRTARSDRPASNGSRRSREEARIHRLSPAEREIVIGKCDDEQHWHVYSSSLTAIGRRLLRVAEAVGAEVRQVDRWGWEAKLPKAAISFRVPRALTMSEAQRKAAKTAGERLAKMRVRRTGSDGWTPTASVDS